MRANSAGVRDPEPNWSIARLAVTTSGTRCCRNGRGSIGLADLAGRAVIALPVGTGIRHQFDRACAEAGIAVHDAFEASTPHALADLAERGLGVALLPESMARSRPVCTLSR